VFDHLEVAPNVLVTGTGAAFLPRSRTAIIADVHLGYAHAARRRGGYLPAIETATAVATRTIAMLDILGAERLVIAGDLRHSTRDVDAAEHHEVDTFLAMIRSRVTVEYVAGNHDRGASARQSMEIDDIHVVHAPPSHTPDIWTICGHLHPVALVRDETGAGERFPCFLVGEHVVVLPAFSAWAGGTPARRLRSMLPPGRWRTVAVHDTRLYPIADHS